MGTINAQRGLLSEADEALRRDHAELGVTPAQKRLETVDVSGSEAHDGLVMKRELSRREDRFRA